LSELPHGLVLPPPAPPARPIPAAAVIAWREAGGAREILWARRGTSLKFAAGFHAFPGGKIERSDSEVPVRGADPDEAAALAAAARELFEEVGILPAAGAARLAGSARDEARRALLDGRLGFGELLAREALALDAADFLPAGRWVTPPDSPLRFDARFYLWRTSADLAPAVWEGELEAAEWVPTGEALGRWSAGQALLHPPALWPIQCLDRAGPPECLGPMRAPPQTEQLVTRRLQFQRGLFVAPLRTPTLPPATHTNAWLPAIEGGLALVDPGSPYPGEQAALERLLDEYAAEGLPPREIWVTHAHQDHVGGIARLRERYGLRLRAHADAAARLPPAAGLAEPVADGQPMGGGWVALHTPGHAHGHLVFHHERTGALLAGDLVSTLSTIVVDPPEGDMAVYLGSLERVRRLGPRTLYTAHGPPAAAGTRKLEEYLAHRRAREEKVLAALPGPLDEVTARAYDDTPPVALPVAARSCLATLLKLRQEGRAAETAGVWSRR